MSPTPPVPSDDPFSDEDAQPPLRSDGVAEVTKRILAKHAARRTNPGDPAPRSSGSGSLAATGTSGIRPEVVVGIVASNGWLGPEALDRLRELMRTRAATQAVAARSGVGDLLVANAILSPELAQRLDLVLHDHGAFPRYRITRLLGSGRIGHSYLALDIQTGTDVAFTVFRQADPAKRQRFLDEFTTLERIRSRRIARALACGVNGDACFAAWSLVPGEPLAQLIADQRIVSEVRAVRIALQVAEGLAYVNVYTSRCHLAVRPETVLVHEQDGDRLAVVVTDFGLAEQAAGDRSSDYEWLAPELASGGAGDARSDIYAVGALLCGMLRTLPGADVGDGVDISLFHELTREVAIAATCPEPSGRYPDHRTLVAALTRTAHALGHVEKDEPPATSAPAPPGPGTRLLQRLLPGTGRRERTGDKDDWID